MTLPSVSPLQTVAVTGRYTLASNVPAEGYVLMTPVQQVVGSGWVVVGCSVTATVVDGLLSATVVTNPGVIPDLYLRVEEHIEGCPSTPYTIRPTGPLVDLATAPRVVAPPPGVAYVLASSLGQPNGVATLGPDSKLTLSQRPEGSGGGAVASVNGRTGVVILNAADIGAYTIAQVNNLVNTLNAQIAALEARVSVLESAVGEAVYPSLTLFPLESLYP